MTLDDYWLSGIDLDQGLLDVRDDDNQPWEIRALAGASVGIDPIVGSKTVAELSDAVADIVRGDDRGKRELAKILGRAGSDYQRCLWFMLAGRHPLDVATRFAELGKLMAARAALMFEAHSRGLTSTKHDDPYWTAIPEGPRATFDANFELGSHWDPYLPAKLFQKD